MREPERINGWWFLKVAFWMMVIGGFFWVFANIHRSEMAKHQQQRDHINNLSPIRVLEVRVGWYSGCRTYVVESIGDGTHMEFTATNRDAPAIVGETWSVQASSDGDYPTRPLFTKKLQKQQERGNRCQNQ